MVLHRKRSAPLRIPAYGSDEVADVTGAGDTVIAVFTLALLAGADLADAARSGQLRRGHRGHEGRNGHDRPRRADRGDRRGSPMSGMNRAAAKVIELSRSGRDGSGRRQAGRTVALANGLFDILHVGHLRYLEGASSRPICSWSRINSDARRDG